MSRPSTWFLLTTLLALGTAIGLWGWVGGEPWDAPPGLMGDDVYFENIAWELLQGKGIAFDFGDEDWREPFRQWDRDDRFRWVLYLNHSGVTTSRSPGFPFVMAAIYRMAGRRFFLVRWFNAIVLWASLATLILMTARWYGQIVAALALGTLSLDFFVLRTASQFMTEALGTAILVWVFISVVRLTRSPPKSVRRAIVAWFAVGWLFGFGTLVRANLNAWFLMIVCGIIVASGIQALRRRDWQTIAGYGGCFIIGTLVVTTPWWVRNCYVTGGFAPFGTSGSFGLVGGYCDEAFDDFGNWNLKASVDCQQEAIQQPGFLKKTLAEQEYAMGRLSVQKSITWIRSNLERLPQLMAMKGLSHLGFYRQPLPLEIINGLMLIGALIGIIVFRREIGFWVAIVLTMSILTACITWPHYGRYSLPIRPLVHVASALGTVALWQMLLRKSFIRDQSIQTGAVGE